MWDLCLELQHRQITFHIHIATQMSSESESISSWDCLALQVMCRIIFVSCRLQQCIWLLNDKHLKTPTTPYFRHYAACYPCRLFTFCCQVRQFHWLGLSSDFSIQLQTCCSIWWMLMNTECNSCGSTQLLYLVHGSQIIPLIFFSNVRSKQGIHIATSFNGMPS